MGTTAGIGLDKQKRAGLEQLEESHFASSTTDGRVAGDNTVTGRTHNVDGVVATNMISAVLHAGEPHLPLAPDTAGIALGVGLVVVLAVVYDYYCNDWNGGA